MKGPLARSRMVMTAVAFMLTVSGCTGERDEVRMETNLANQRKAAIAFLEQQGGVETIRFTQEGDKPGLGAYWSANAVVTIAGVEYQEIIGPRVLGGDPLPSIAPGAITGPVTVISAMSHQR